MSDRIGKVVRKTMETDIKLKIDLDGQGDAEVSTGVGFFDHMMLSFAKHGLFDLRAQCQGDLGVDCHHTIEDMGIALGTAIGQALGDKAGIKRYGSMLLPMDEALVMCAVDLSGRPYLNYEIDFNVEKIGDMDSQMVKEFFYALAYSAKITLHLKKLSGENGHHVAEAAFKAFARALSEAVSKDPRVDGVWSSKGIL